MCNIAKGTATSHAEPRLWHSIQHLLQAQSHFAHTDFNHVYGHNLNPFNELADALADATAHGLWDPTPNAHDHINAAAAAVKWTWLEQLPEHTHAHSTPTFMTECSYCHLSFPRRRSQTSPMRSRCPSLHQLQAQISTSGWVRQAY